ncbi:MAG: amidophosphoribosyltransferase [Bacteroidales bacterium]|nr:MAG: amidophosphoribosyltransferase [Bacteroidales bacterium]
MGGFFGTISKNDCINDLFYGTDYNSHLGTRRGGMAVYGPEGFTRRIHNLESSYFRTKFEPDLPEFNGNSGIGVISDTESQPILLNSHLGKFAIVTVGKITNLDDLERKALQKKWHFSETGFNGPNPSEMVAMLINEGSSIEEGIRIVHSSVKGSISMLILMEKGIFAARDRLGRTPVVIGWKKDAFAFASESSCFPTLGYHMERSLGPGEIVFMTADGYEQVSPPGEKMQICAFLWVYYGYPPSDYEGKNVEQTRYNCGAALAVNDDAEADYVSGIPDSGIGHAIGYAKERQIPYMRPYVKYTPTWPRSFMPGNQEVRDLVAKMKLIPVKPLIEGKKVIFCDDSIVRGTQLKDNVRIFVDYGVREIHMRIACPPLCYACEFLNFSASKSTLELAARKAIYELEGKDDKHLDEYSRSGSTKYEEMVEHIREKLKLTSLKYQQLDDLVKAIGLPKEKLCTHCFDGSSFF